MFSFQYTFSLLQFIKSTDFYEVLDTWLWLIWSFVWKFNVFSTKFLWRLGRTSEFIIYGHGQQRRAIIEAERILEHAKSDGLGDAVQQYDGDIKNSFKDKAKKWLKFVTQVTSTVEDSSLIFFSFDSFCFGVLEALEEIGQPLQNFAPAKSFVIHTMSLNITKVCPHSFYISVCYLSPSAHMHSP